MGASESRYLDGVAFALELRSVLSFDQLRLYARDGGGALALARLYERGHALGLSDFTRAQLRDLLLEPFVFRA